MEPDLTRLKQTWTEVTARDKEWFHYPEADTQGQWPTNYAAQLGVNPGHNMVEDPAAGISKSAYLVKHEAAWHMAKMAKAQELFGLTSPGQAREIVARCPELGHGLGPFMDDWTWFEATSGIFAKGEARDEAGRRRQQKIVPALISNLIWKLKMQARAETLAVGDPEPLLNLQTLRDSLVDIAYIPGWAGGATSYFKKNIDSESARKFADDCVQGHPHYDPYTAAASCAACDAAIAPGTLSNHIKGCQVLVPGGYRLKCACQKEFKSLAALTQHRVLHCRAGDSCRACNADTHLAPCQCQRRRKNLCAEIWKELEATEAGTGSIYDLSNERAIVATRDELIHLLRTAADASQEAADEMPMWKLLDDEGSTHDTWTPSGDAEMIEMPHTQGDADSSTISQGSDQESVIEPKARPNTGTPSGGDPECAECGAQFPEIHRLITHMKDQHNAQVGEQCGICNDWLPDSKQLQMHVRSQHADPFRCDLCTHKCKSVMELIKHIRTHEKCGQCDRMFFTNEALTEHEREDHSTFRCRLCGHTERSAAGLADHQTTICGLTCTICRKNGWSTETLELHMSRDHPRCKTCETRFTDKPSFVKHLPCGKERDGYKCGICGVAGLSKPELEKHSKSAHPQCSRCKKAFPTQLAFLKHKPCPHKEEEKADGEEDTYNYRCVKCGAAFLTAVGLLDHDRRNHQRTNKSPLTCIDCGATIEEQDYMNHVRSHSRLYRWELRGLTCPTCPGVALGSIAETVEHVSSAHKEAFPGFLTSVEQEKKKNHKLSADQALVRAVRLAMGSEDEFKCLYEHCRQIFFTAEELEHHKKSHECSTCGFLPRDPREMADHERQHGRAKTEGNFPCNKCGQKLTSYDELVAHEETHNKYSCNKCRQKFPSSIEANRHELTCGAIADMSVYGAASSNDPTLVLAKCLQTMVTANEGTLEPGTADLMRDQIKKAISTQSGKSILRKNHNTQKTYTFIRAPGFQPSNTTTTYTDKDINPLRACMFSGQGSPEENFTKLNELVQAIARVVKSRSLTRDVSTELLLQHLKSPAKDLATSYREEFELRYGNTAVPDFQDVLLYLESSFINIRPHHAREQLLALKRHPGETLTAFYIRAWRCSHFASFTEKEAERPKFRETLVKEAVMRNLSPKQREAIDQEELQRGLRDEAPLGPREIVDHLNNMRAHKESLEGDRPRTDFSTVGHLTARSTTIGVEGMKTRKQFKKKTVTSKERRSDKSNTAGPAQTQKRRRQFDEPTKRLMRLNRSNNKRIRTTTTDSPAPLPQGGRERPTQMAKTDNTRRWVEAATALTGPGTCWKCARKGHGHKECRTYTVLMKHPCPACKKSFHHPKACQANRPATGRGGNPARGRGSQQPNARPSRSLRARGQAPPARPQGQATGANKTPQAGRGRGGATRAGRGGRQARSPFLRTGRTRKETDPVEDFMQALQNSP